MAAPAILEYGGDAAVVDRIAGPIAATVGTVAIWRVTRALRRLLLPVGAWLLLAPWMLDSPGVATFNSLACGLVLIACSFSRGRPGPATGGGWRALSDHHNSAAE